MCVVIISGVNTHTVRPLADLIYVLLHLRLIFRFCPMLSCMVGFRYLAMIQQKKREKAATNTKTSLLLSLPSCTHPIDSFPFPAKELGPRNAVISKTRMFSHKTFAFVSGKMCQMSLLHKGRAHSVHQLVGEMQYLPMYLMQHMPAH